MLYLLTDAFPQRLSKALFVTSFVLACNAAQACAVCMGAQGTPQMDGVNAGLLTMLGMMATVFGLGAFFVARMAWLAHRVECAAPTQAQELLQGSETTQDCKEIGG